MKTKLTKIKFYPHEKFKNWEVPEGDYASMFEDYELQDEGVVILKFRIVPSVDDIEDYWVRQRYRREDMRKLHSHLKSWLGYQEFRKIFLAGELDFQELLGRDADLRIGLLEKNSWNTQLRIIEEIHPPGTLVALITPEERVQGEFNI